MKLVEVHVCPLWEEADGRRRPGMAYEDPHPRVVGWCNVLIVNLGGAIERLLAVHYSD